MGLDIHVVAINGEVTHIVMSENLYSSIFSTSTRWSSSKTLRKIKDYYKANCLLKNKDAVSFIHELTEMGDRITDGKDELNKLIENLKNIQVSSIRLSGD